MKKAGAKKDDSKKAAKKEEDKTPPDPRKIILITGCNRGLGLAFTESLIKRQPQLRIIMTSRDPEKGEAAYKALCEKYPEDVEHFFFHQLDITNEESITEMIDYIKKTFKKFDYLVNNAGYSSTGTDFNETVCEETFNVNFNGTVNFTEKILGANIFNKGGKIIFVSSKSGTLNKVTNDNNINKFKNAKASDDIVKLADKFKKSVAEGKAQEEGWYLNCFAMSKMFLNFYVKLLVKKREVTKEALGVYSLHPGWLKTDMGGETAPEEVSAGVERLTFLLDLPDVVNKDYQGKFFEDNKVTNFEGVDKPDDKKKDKKKK